MVKWVLSPVIGAAVGAGFAFAALAILSRYGVDVPREVTSAYRIFGIGAGFAFGFAFPFTRSGSERDNHAVLDFVAPIGAIFYILSALFLYWGWPAYHVAPRCPASVEGHVLSGSTTERWTTNSRTGTRSASSFERSVRYVYTVDGIEYAGSGETSLLRYDPKHPEIHYSGGFNEGALDRVREAPYLFAAGVGIGVLGVLAIGRLRGVWGICVGLAFAGAIATTAVIAVQDIAVSDVIRANGETALRHQWNKLAADAQRAEDEKNSRPDRP